MLAKVMFFIAATLCAIGIAVLGASAMIISGLLVDMPIPTMIVAASSAAITAFGITVGVFSLAAALFFTPLAAPPATARGRHGTSHGGKP